MEKEEKYLFTDWGSGLSSFKIYDSYDSRNLITKRIISEDNCVNWFNIDNVKREIDEYAKLNNLKFIGIGDTINDIHDNGFSYSDKDKEKTIIEICKRNETRDKGNRFSNELRIIE